MPTRIHEDDDTRYEEHLFVASAARTATGNSGTLDLDADELESLALFVDVSAASGTTPTLVVKLQESPDEGTTWFDNGATTASLSAAGQSRLTATAPFCRKLRIVWTVGGTTPSFTFSVRGVGRRPR